MPGVAAQAPIQAPAPTTLILSGQVTFKAACLGVYTLMVDREANGWPVWQHVRENRCIARIPCGDWVVQREENVGVNDLALMRQVDRMMVLPHECSAGWQEGDGSRWHEVPLVKCGILRQTSPMNFLVMSGDATYKGASLGVYRLEVGREANGWPVWKHVSKDLCIARSAGGDWVVQLDEHVGMNDLAFMRLIDDAMAMPQECSAEWQEVDSNGWYGAPQVKCSAYSPVPPIEVQSFTTMKKTENCARPEFLQLVSEEFQHQPEFLSSPSSCTVHVRF